MLTGAPGIGKTTLWEAGFESAAARGLRVLRARPTDAEAQLSFAGLGDLLDGIELETLRDLPPPQVAALEVALYRADPGDDPPDPHAIALGVLNALRSLAAADPLLLAIDDVQWLDAPTGDALAFAARRLRDQPVRFLLAKRTGARTALEQALKAFEPERLEVEALRLGAIRRMLFERLGLTLPRRTFRRVFEITQGNPLYALELGRSLAQRGPVEPGEDIPVPEAVEELLGTRVSGLPRPLRRLLLALALSGDLRVSQLAPIAEPDVLAEALDGGLVALDGDRLLPAHPLLAAAAKEQSRADEQREVHRALADAIGDPELRARHLALATERPDGELAELLASTAVSASARGARQEAVELAEYALALTPRESAERPERLLLLAGYLEAAGERQRVTDVLAPELDSLPSGEARVRAHLYLSEGGGVRSARDHEEHLERALAESGGEPALRAHVLAKKTIHATACCVDRIPEAEAWGLEALPAAPQAGPEVERLALHGLAWARSLRGEPIDDVCDRFRAASPDAFHITDSPDQVAALRLIWRGDIEGARPVLTRLLGLADQRGEAVSYALQRVNLCDLELRAGEWESVARRLDEWAAESEGPVVAPTYQRTRALLAAGQGLADEAEQWATQAVGGGEAIGVRWQVLEALRARGIAALLAREPAKAVESLREVWEHTEREGVDDPGAFPVAPELVEALVELGELEQATAVVERLGRLAQEQEHPWGLASAKRCAALVRLAAGYDEQAATELGDAAAAYAQLGLRFDEARALLNLGRALRRQRKRAAARRALERAGSLFEELGSPGWAEQAREELARIGGRGARPSGELTPSEARVVELAANGLSNKEIAQELVVTVRTVEAHLSHAYGKLGIRSRSQLARRLSEQA